MSACNLQRRCAVASAALATIEMIALGCVAIWPGGVPSALAQTLPNLVVAPVTNQTVTLSWNVPTVGYGLQEATNLTTPAAWRTSPLVPVSNACAFSVTVPVANATRFFRLAATTPPAVGLYLGAPQQLLQAGELGMTDVPDMHTAIMRQPDSSYRLWIAGRFESDTVEGATGLLLTTNFMTYTPGFGPATKALPVLVPSCRGATASSACWTNFDSDYAGADLVFTATNGTDLLMLYHGETKAYGTNPPSAQNPGWAVVGLARSSDRGVTWTNRSTIVSGSDPKPTVSPAAGIFGAVEPGAIIASNYIYAFYAYFPTPNSTNPGPVIQVARSALTNDAAPGTWTKYYNGAFGSEPGLGGLGSSIIPAVCGCTRPAQPWPVFSTYLNAYVLVFVGEEGWFFSTSTNLLTWTPPTQFFTAPNNEFTPGQPTDENVILVTPGNPDQVIGQTGLVLYAHTPAWRNVSHELWSRPFMFSKSP